MEWEDTEEKVRHAHILLHFFQCSASVAVCDELNACVCRVLQLRTAMVKGETGTLSLDVRTSVDKGVSRFCVCVSRGKVEPSKNLASSIRMFLVFIMSLI